ncbi:MAG: hypothetical protein NW200_11245 [Hyphomonadaceae bacterium]|nr:hypothetical protein [Hyphomonadaceae bacterium]
MGVTILEPPPVEPVSTAEARVFLRLEGDAEEGAIDAFIGAARNLVEAWSGRALVRRRVLESWSGSPHARDGWIRLAFAPVSLVHEVRVADQAGVRVVGEADVTLDGAEGRIRLASPSAAGPGVDRVEIDYEAGYAATADAAPPALRHAVLLAVASLYEGREGDGPSLAAARGLTAPWQRVRL